MQDIKEIFTDQIKLPLDNMREYIDRDELFELAEDIKKNGLISPITVRPINCGSHTEFGVALTNDNVRITCTHCFYELVAGQRRYLAHQIGGILKIKCLVRELTDEEALAIMTSENLARVDVNPVDEAKHITRLMHAHDNDIKKVMHIVGRGERWVRDRIAIGEMPDYMQELLANKEIKIGVALVLNQINDDELRRMWTFQAARDGVSVPMAEYWLADFKARLLPDGKLPSNDDGQNTFAPPQTVMFTCAIDGQKYDTRTLRSIVVYEGNLEIFNAFVSEFRKAPVDSES